MPSNTKRMSVKRTGAHGGAYAVAFAALFVALSGGAYAAGDVGSKDIAKKAIGSKHLNKKAVRARHIQRQAVRPMHIRKRSIRPVHVRRNAIRGGHVRDGSLRTADVRGLDKTVKGLGEGLATTGGYIGNLLSEVDSLKQRMSDAESNHTSLAADLSALESQVNSLSSSSDSRLDALCAEADTVNQEVNDLIAALDAASLTGLVLDDVTLPDFDPTECEG